jgi:hypothetical protein
MMREVLYESSYWVIPIWLIMGYLNEDIRPLNHICSIYGIGVLLFLLIYALFFTQKRDIVIHFSQFFSIIFVVIKMYMYFLMNMRNQTTDLVYRFNQNDNKEIVMQLNVYYIILHFSLFLISLFIAHPICVWMFRLIILFLIFQNLLYSTTLNNNEVKFADLLIIALVIVYWMYRKRHGYLWMLIAVMIFIVTSIIYTKIPEENVYLIGVLNLSNIGVIICLILLLITSTDFDYKFQSLYKLPKIFTPSVMIRKIRTSDLKKLLV